MPMIPKLTIRKYGGDDSCSYAVFAIGNRVPIVTGCTRAEARSHKATLEAMYAERARRGGSPSTAFEAGR
jgi:hypothetical protein